MENWPCTIEVREPTPTLNKTPITKLSLLKTPKRCSLLSVIAYLDMATFLKIKSNFALPLPHYIHICLLICIICVQMLMWDSIDHKSMIT